MKSMLERGMKTIVVRAEHHAALKRLAKFCRRNLPAQFGFLIEGWEEEALKRLTKSERDRYFKGTLLFRESEHIRKRARRNDRRPPAPPAPAPRDDAGDGERDDKRVKQLEEVA
jgi:hypothetical protein